jgi:glutathione S-transferase
MSALNSRTGRLASHQPLADGTVLAQQRSILRLIGKQTNLYPNTTTDSNDPLKAAKIDEWMDVVEVINLKTNYAGWNMEQSEKEAARQAALAKGGNVHTLLQKVDQAITANGEGCFTVGDQLTIADLFTYTTLSALVCGDFDGVPSNALEEFQGLNALRKKVRSHPAVEKWYKELDPFIQVPAAYSTF